MADGQAVEARRRGFTALEEALLLQTAARAVGGQALTQAGTDLVRRAVLGGPLPLPGCVCCGSVPMVLRDGLDSHSIRVDGASDKLVSFVDRLLALRDAAVGGATREELREQARRLVTLSLETES